jgi:hypothetical protein
MDDLHNRRSTRCHSIPSTLISHFDIVHLCIPSPHRRSSYSTRLFKMMNYVMLVSRQGMCLSSPGATHRALKLTLIPLPPCCYRSRLSYRPLHHIDSSTPHFIISSTVTRQSPLGQVVSDAAKQTKSKDCQGRHSTRSGPSDANVQLSRIQRYVCSTRRQASRQAPVMRMGSG